MTKFMLIVFGIASFYAPFLAMVKMMELGWNIGFIFPTAIMLAFVLLLINACFWADEEEREKLNKKGMEK